MLVLLSPAKKLDFAAPLPTKAHSQPHFQAHTTALIERLKTQSVMEIAALMNLSATLAQLNAQRYAQWAASATEENARPAVFAFNGDVYAGLQALHLDEAQLHWAQAHVVILSGLYGALRPLDLIQPYRLEMGSRLETSRGKNLYAFWGSEIAAYLNQRLASPHPPIVVNLASEEYFKAVDLKTLRARVVQCVFQEEKGETWKVIGLHAKLARGLMARYIIQHEITDVAALQRFQGDGYGYAAKASSANTLVFRRHASSAGDVSVSSVGGKIPER